MVLADEPAPPDATGDADDDATGDDEAGAAAVLDEVELHAAAPTARLAAIPDTASRRRFFTVFSLTGVVLVLVFCAGWQPVRLALR
jgi:hypothetical protein